MSTYVKRTVLVLSIMILYLFTTGTVTAVTKDSSIDGKNIVDSITDKAANQIEDSITSQIKKEASQAVAQMEKQGETVVKNQLKSKNFTDIMKHPIFLIIVALFVISLIAKLLKVAISLAALAVAFVIVKHFLKF